MKIRIYKPNDRNFILNSYNKYMLNTVGRFIKSDVKELFYEQVIKCLVSSQIAIACSEEDDNQILGYSIYNSDEKILYMLYVKQAFRCLGIENRLCDVIGISKKNVKLGFIYSSRKHKDFLNTIFTIKEYDLIPFLTKRIK